MKVFISWSGPLSLTIAKALKDWLPSVIQAIKPFLSSEDIRKGARWGTEIAAELEISQIGIIVLTRDNREAPWIHFEAGALSKSMDKSKVCTLLFGLSPTDVAGPLTEFQATTFSKDEMFKLVETINLELEEAKLPDTTLYKSFEKFWPELEQAINQALKNHESVAEEEELRDPRELLEEILTIVRGLRKPEPLTSEYEPLFPLITGEPYSPRWPLRHIHGTIKSEKEFGLLEKLEIRLRKLSPHTAKMLLRANYVSLEDDTFHAYFDSPDTVLRISQSKHRIAIERVLLILTGRYIKFKPREAPSMEEPTEEEMDE